MCTLQFVYVFVLLCFDEVFSHYGLRYVKTTVTYALRWVTWCFTSFFLTHKLFIVISFTPVLLVTCVLGSSVVRYLKLDRR